MYSLKTNVILSQMLLQDYLMEHMQRRCIFCIVKSDHEPPVLFTYQIKYLSEILYKMNTGAFEKKFPFYMVMVISCQMFTLFEPVLSLNR